MSSEGLRQWEGRQVSVALADGSRIDDCQLVSAGRCAAGTLWLHQRLRSVRPPRPA